jgi:hypothetical protein
MQAELEEVLTQELFGRKARFTVGGMTEAGVKIHGRLDTKNGGHVDSWGIHSMENGIRVFVPFIGEKSCLSEEEQRVWNMVGEAILNAGANRATTAYHGVLACGERGYQDHRYVMLLRDKFLPNVNMGRDVIMGFPLEAVCCCAMGGMPSKGSDASWKQATERELWSIMKLDRYQSWRDQLEKEKEPHIGAQFPLWATYWKQKGRVIYENGKLRAEAGDPMAKKTEYFPAGMFVEVKDPVFRVSYTSGKGVYNCDHPFSQWLVLNRDAFATYAHNLYNTMLRTMMLMHDPGKIRNILNRIMDKLRSQPGNPVHVPDGLILTEEDFK